MSANMSPSLPSPGIAALMSPNAQPEDDTWRAAHSASDALWDHHGDSSGGRGQCWRGPRAWRSRRPLEWQVEAPGAWPSARWAPSTDGGWP